MRAPDESPAANSQATPQRDWIDLTKESPKKPEEKVNRPSAAQMKTARAYLQDPVVGKKIAVAVNNCPDTYKAIKLAWAKPGHGVDCDSTESEDAYYDGAEVPDVLGDFDGEVDYYEPSLREDAPTRRDAPVYQREGVYFVMAEKDRELLKDDTSKFY